MRIFIPLVKLNLTLAAILVASCGPSTTTGRSMMGDSGAISPNLVTGHQAEMTAEWQDPWLQGRNDDQLGSIPRWQDGYDEQVITHSREILWTHDGRPHESTRTRTEIIRRR